MVKQKHYSAASQRQEDLFSLNYELLSTLLFAKLKCLQLEVYCISFVILFFAF